MGRVYQRGHVWWVQYSFNGRKHRESTSSRNRADAVRLLRSRLEEVGRGRLIGRTLEKTTFSDLAELLLTDYRINRKRSLARIEDGTQHLRRAFSGLTAVCLTSDRIMAYIRARPEAGAANGTINRELFEGEDKPHVVWYRRRLGSAGDSQLRCFRRVEDRGEALPRVAASGSSGCSMPERSERVRRRLDRDPQALH
jgi:hypothetical protein